MDTKTFLHKHYLLYDEYTKQEACCDKCNGQIDGWAFTCENCKFWLHKSCALLPPRISHPIHKYLFSDVSDRDFVCDRCFTLSRGYVFKNEDYSYKLDFKCAFSTDDQTPREESRISKGMGKQMQHFSHKDSLTLFNYRKVRKYEYCCDWCEKPLSEMSYGCFHCTEQFFLHQFCLYNIPNRILEHPFHPKHPLYISYKSSVICRACNDDSSRESQYYSCHKCKFHLHVLCSKFKPTLRHECHPKHKLTYIKTKTQKVVFKIKCNKCDSFSEAGDWNEETFYRCVQCNFNIHFKCLIPPTIRHEYHRHSLTVMTSFIEDYSGEYYCDICEKQRNPKHHVYYCKECTYFAHIECALDKFIGTNFDCGSTFSLKYEETQQSDANIPSHSLMEYFKHDHLLQFKEVIKIEDYGNKKLLCRACGLEIWDQAYLCSRRRCKYYLHKTCAALPSELLHPSHSDHPLFLQHISSWDGFKCDKCRNISCELGYICFLCNFKLDIKCILDAGSETVDQELKKTERPTATATNLAHFIHNHELLSVSCSPTNIISFWCGACCCNISGQAYGCLKCDFHMHETCLGQLQREIRIPYHPSHSLLPFDNSNHFFDLSCLACKHAYNNVGYGCRPCDIYLHFYCASSLKHPLRLKSHPHNLYLFHKDKVARFYRSLECEKCDNYFVGESIYRCIDCDINFHLKCAGIPHEIQSKCHIHPLTLKNSFVEDDLGEYYCDACEEDRDPKEDVYYCQECDGLFVTHLDCAVSKVEQVLQQ